MPETTERGEGVMPPEAYTLEHWVGGDRGAGYFVARGEDGERVLVKLVPEGRGDAERQLEVWARTRHLRHANVLEVRAAGRLSTGGQRYVYVAFEYPDDRLAGALEQAPLTGEEARGVVEAIAGALRYLHGQGLAHGAIDPLHIVAKGETVKLIPDALREAEGMEAYAEDVRQLGQLVRKVRAPEPVAEPLATIARHACEPDARQRWTLAEIAQALEAPTPVPAPTAAPAPVPAAAPAAVEPAGEAVREHPVLPPPHVRRSTIEPGSPGPFPKWIFVAVGVLLLMILGLNLRRKPNAAEAPAKPAPAVENPAPAAPTARDAKAETARAETPKAAPIERVKAGGSPQQMWRVIAYAYGSYAMASKKAKQVNQRWPDLRAAVFVPGERRGYYLVALGGRMSREEAVRLQRRAREMGLPRDAYVQNYAE